MSKYDAKEVHALAEDCRLSYWSENDYADETQQAGGFAVVAEISGKIIGFVVARLIMSRTTTTNIKDNKSNSEANRESKVNLEAETKKKLTENDDVKTKLEVNILNICIKDDFREKGIGKKLLESLFEHISAGEQPESAEIWLEVRSSNKIAVDFYRANNFEIVGRRRNFYNNPVEDALNMKMVIESR